MSEKMTDVLLYLPVQGSNKEGGSIFGIIWKVLVSFKVLDFEYFFAFFFFTEVQYTLSG